MSTQRSQQLNRMPGMSEVLARVVVAGSRNALKRYGMTPEHMVQRIRPRTIEATGVRLNGNQLQRYRALCGFGSSGRVPATFLHLPAFPLHLTLITDSSFPLPLAGLIHLSNRIEQFRPPVLEESLDYRAHLTTGRQTEKGIEFDIVTEVTSGDALIWREQSTNLYRVESRKRSGVRKACRPGFPDYPNVTVLDLPENLGRRYAAISGDYNPIHLHALSARTFGFPRAIIHGMWSHARLLAELERQWEASVASSHFEVECHFKLPVCLPSTVCILWRELEGASQRGTAFVMTDKRRTKPHLTGRLEMK